MSAVALHSPRRLTTVDAPAAVDAPVVVTSGRRTLALALATALVIVAAVFGVVGLTAMAADMAVEARSLEMTVANAERQYAELVAEVAAKEDPGRIRELALELGLVPSPAARHLILSRGIDADGARRPTEVGSVVTDPLKSVLTQGR
jgi:cell division protein FtsL